VISSSSPEGAVYQECIPNSELSLSKSWLSQTSYRSGRPIREMAIRNVLQIFLDMITWGSFIPCWLFFCMFNAVRKCSMASLQTENKHHVITFSTK
jgi:hypothetical protein